MSPRRPSRPPLPPEKPDPWSVAAIGFVRGWDSMDSDRLAWEKAAREGDAGAAVAALEGSEALVHKFRVLAWALLDAAKAEDVERCHNEVLGFARVQMRLEPRAPNWVREW